MQDSEQSIKKLYVPSDMDRCGSINQSSWSQDEGAMVRREGRKKWPRDEVRPGRRRKDGTWGTFSFRRSAPRRTWQRQHDDDGNETDSRCSCQV
jgi:hypothetical protein